MAIDTWGFSLNFQFQFPILNRPIHLQWHSLFAPPRCPTLKTPTIYIKEWNTYIFLLNIFFFFCFNKTLFKNTFFMEGHHLDMYSIFFTFIWHRLINIIFDMISMWSTVEVKRLTSSRSLVSSISVRNLIHPKFLLSVWTTIFWARLDPCYNDMYYHRIIYRCSVWNKFNFWDHFLFQCLNVWAIFVWC